MPLFEPQSSAFTIDLHHPFMSPSAAATNNGAAQMTAVSDPSMRQMLNLESAQAARLTGRLGGAITPATKMVVQYHLAGDIAIPTADTGWKTLYMSAGSHVLNQMFYAPEFVIPDEAKINNVLIRGAIYGGDGAVDPTISCCILNIY